MLKQCRTCKEFKNEETEYYKNGIRNGKPRNGYATECIYCFKLRSKKNSSKEIRRFNIVKYKYGVSKEQYKQLLDLYPVCEICKEPFPKDEPCVDHSHTTGQIRALLCHDCNIGLGRFKDNENRLLNAIAYLQKFNA